MLLFILSPTPECVVEEKLPQWVHLKAHWRLLWCLNWAQHQNGSLPSNTSWHLSELSTKRFFQIIACHGSKILILIYGQQLVVLSCWCPWIILLTVDWELVLRALHSPCKFHLIDNKFFPFSSMFHQTPGFSLPLGPILGNPVRPWNPKIMCQCRSA